MKKTRMLLFVLLLFVSIFSSACSNAEQADVDSGDEQDSGEANEVRIVSLSNDEASFAEGFELMGNTLEEKYQINFDINNHADTTAYQSTLRTSLSTSQAPGFFKWWSGYRMEELVHDGLLADLTGTWDTLIDQGVNPDLANAFKFDDKMYGLPLTSNYWIIFYNMDVFKENGIDIPNSWDEFMQVNETLKENGIVPLAQSVDDRWPAFIWFEELMVRYDADLFVDLMEGRASYTDPSVIEVMEIWKSLYDHGYFSEPLNWQNTMASEFANGNVAMIAMGDWYTSILTGQGMEPGEDFGAFILPPIKPDAGNNIIFEAGALLISENSADKELALEAAEHLYEKEIIGEWTREKGMAPLVPGVESNNPIIDSLMETIETDEYRLINRYWEGTPPDISEFAVDQFARFMLNPNEYMDVLETIENHATDYWGSN